MHFCSYNFYLYIGAVQIHAQYNDTIQPQPGKCSTAFSSQRSPKNTPPLAQLYFLDAKCGIHPTDIFKALKAAVHSKL